MIICMPTTSGANISKSHLALPLKRYVLGVSVPINNLTTILAQMLAELAGDLYNIAVHVVNDVINMAMSDVWSQTQTEVGEQDLLFHDFGMW